MGTMIWNTPEYFKGATVEDIRRDLAAGAKLNVHEKKGMRMSPLHWAARCSRDVEVFKALLEAGAQVNARDFYKYTPLHNTSSRQHPEVIKVLLDGGADPKAKDKWGFTPLHYAAKEGHPAVVKQLLDAGSKVDEQTYGGKTALHFAVMRKDTVTPILYLLYAGADVKAKDNCGSTPKELLKRNEVLKDTESYRQLKKDSRNWAL